MSTEIDKPDKKGKKTLYFSEAQYLYVFEMLNLEAISARLPVSTRYLQDWKAEGKWDEKRAEQIKQNNFLLSECETFARLLTQRVNRKLAAGEEVSQPELYTASKLALIYLQNDMKNDATAPVADGETVKPATSSIEDAMKAVEAYLKGTM